MTHSGMSTQVTGPYVCGHVVHIVSTLVSLDAFVVIGNLIRKRTTLHELLGGCTNPTENISSDTQIGRAHV